MKQRHRRAVADGGREASGVGRRKQNHIGNVKVRAEVVDAIARNRRLCAARAESSAQWWRWQSGRFGVDENGREQKESDEHQTDEERHAGTVGQVWSDRKVTSRLNRWTLEKSAQLLEQAGLSAQHLCPRSIAEPTGLEGNDDERMLINTD